MTTPRDIRRARGIPLINVAAVARVSETTARIYEADRERVSAPKREALDRVYAGLDSEPPPSRGAAA